MKHITSNPQAFESTYALIVRSEERERNFSEGAVFLVFMLSVLFSIWATAHQPVTVPAGGIIHTAAIVQSATAQTAQV